jgi:hypothetical protein
MTSQTENFQVIRIVSSIRASRNKMVHCKIVCPFALLAPYSKSHAEIFEKLIFIDLR